MYVDALCDRPVSRGDRVFVGYKRFGRSHHHPETYLSLLVLDSAGRSLGFLLLRQTPGTCATALRDDVLAIAWLTRSSEGSRRVIVTLLLVDDLDAETSFALPANDVSAWTVRIAAYRDGWAVLYADSADVVHVVATGKEGDHPVELAVPAGVDPHTADLGVNERGLFVTWIASGIAHVAAVGERSHHTRRFTRGPGETRAIGDGERCLAAWTNRNGKRIRIVSEPGCP